MNVFLAENAGFCFGVKRAVDEAIKTQKQYNKKIYTLGPLIHNGDVVKYLEDNNIFAIDMNNLDTLNNKIKGEISIDEPLNKDCDGNELLLSDILGTDPDITSRKLEDEVDKKLLKASILKLNPREKNIMEMRFGFKTGKEKTQKEVADELGISQSYISRLEKKIIDKMKKDIMSKTG